MSSSVRLRLGTTAPEASTATPRIVDKSDCDHSLDAASATPLPEAGRGGRYQIKRRGQGGAEKIPSIFSLRLLKDEHGYRTRTSVALAPMLSKSSSWSLVAHPAPLPVFLRRRQTICQAV